MWALGDNEETLGLLCREGPKAATFHTVLWRREKRWGWEGGLLRDVMYLIPMVAL